RHRPDVTVTPILFPIDRRHHIGDRRAVGREMRVAERFERQIIGCGDAARLRGGRYGARGEDDGKNSQLFHARALFFGIIREIFSSAGRGFFFVELIESRLFLSASIRFTTFGGASTSGVTISRPSIFASMISRRPSWYSSRYDSKSMSPSNVPITCSASFTSAGLIFSGSPSSSSIASI